MGTTISTVSIEADVTVHADGAADLAARLADRYWHTPRPEHRALREAYTVEEALRRIVLHPRRVTRGPG